MKIDLQGQKALVTGSTSGIGQAIGEALAQAGAAVVISGRDEARGKAVVEGIRAAGGAASFVRADLDSASSARALADEAEQVLGQVDILVNNAGIFEFGPTESWTEESFDAIFDVNVKAPLFLTGRLAPAMVGRRHGRIINVTTTAAHVGMAGAAVYGASKGALRLMTQAWAAEYGPHGVNVNSIAPGPIRTPGTAVLGDLFDQIAKTVPAGRAGETKEVAAVALFLASGDASFVNGATVAVDGGRAAV